PIGIRGLVGVGLMAAVISTADSFLHAAGVLIAHDVLPSFTNSIDPLKASRYATFILGIVALIIALAHDVLPRIQYGGVDLGRGINMALDFVAIVFTVPMIAGIMGLKTDADSFFISLLV